jgi:DNA polymerase-1
VITSHLLVLDAQSIAGRAAHVADGDVARGVRLWCQMVRGAALDLGATHIIAAWDHDGPTFRHALFPGYKNRRTGSMRARISPIRDGVESTGIASISIEGFEGDDAVASLIARFRDTTRITVLSNDSDLLQFVGVGVAVATYVGVGKGEGGTRVKSWSAADVFAKHGVAPSQMPALRALCGETGDDIPGVRNIGASTAVKLLRRWQTIDKALEACEFVSHKDATAKLAGQQEHIRLMLQLTTLRQDAPLPEIAFAHCDVTRVQWVDGSVARRAEVITRTASGPGLEDVPFPDQDRC